MPLFAKSPPNQSWLLLGPDCNSYSLGRVNQALVQALTGLGQTVKVIPNQRAKDYKRALAENPKVCLINDFPPKPAGLSWTEIAKTSKLVILANYAWEETGYPKAWVEEVNTFTHGLTVVSPWVKKILREAGVRRPIAVVGNGVQLTKKSPQRATVDIRELSVSLGATSKAPDVQFLHVSTGLSRKGVDCLVRAFCSAFTANDPVHLVIKTIPNDTNICNDALDLWRDLGPERPRISLISEVWSQEDVEKLISQSDVLVMPSRAEGFGLPLAEAACMGVMGIVTDHGGPRAFANEANSILIESKFKRSASHLGPHLASGLNLVDSLWLEPDETSLAEALKKAFTLPPEARNAFALNMQRQLEASFTWASVARRTVSAVEVLMKRGDLSIPGSNPIQKTHLPSLAWISTFNSRCGIATYSAHLVEGLVRHGLNPEIIANQDAVVLDSTREGGVRRLWRQGSFMIGPLAGALWSRRPKQVLIQQNEGIMQGIWLAKLGSYLQRWGIDAYASLHGTEDLIDNLRSQEGALERMRCFRRLFVHSIADMNRLKTAGLGNQACLLPHGVYSPPTEADRDWADQWIQTHCSKRFERPLLASFGFALPQKGYDVLLTGLAQLSSKERPFTLLLAAKHDSTTSAEELLKLRKLITDLNLADDVVLVDEFLLEAQAIALLSQAALAVFPYQNSSESSSGAVRMAIAAGCAIATTPLGIFEDVKEISYQFRGRHSEDLANGIQFMLSRPNDLRDMVQRAKQYASDHHWSVITARLANILLGDRDDPFPDGLFQAP